MKTVPSQFQPLLPSSDVQDLDVVRDKNYIIQNLIKNSTMEGWKWMLNSYTNADISDVIRTSKILTARDIYFWIYFLKISKEEIPCLNKDSQRTQEKSWAY